MYIDTILKEHPFIDDFIDLLTQSDAPFENPQKIIKVGYSFKYAESEPSLEDKVTFGWSMHNIVQHKLTKMCYGLAVYSEVTLYYYMIPEDIRPAIISETTSQENREKFVKWLTNQVEYYRQTNTYYTYMMEALSESMQVAPAAYVFMSPCIDNKRYCLDMELFEYNLEKEVVWAYPHHAQSPITPIHLRVPTVEEQNFSMPLYAPHQKTNWWKDSHIKVRGVITDTHVFLLIQADKAAAYTDNIVPLIPFYWGLFLPKDPKDQGNHALFAGTATAVLDPNYNLDSNAPYIDAKEIMPLLKDYISYPSNGIDNIMVHRTDAGSKYQAHHLIAAVASNQIPPERMHDKKYYPNAWHTHPSAMAYDFQVNPSRYTKRVDSSRAIVFHPDEGVRGTLPDCLVANPISIRNKTTIKERVQSCPDIHDVYSAFLIEGISPFTKSPTTPFRPLLLALRTTGFKEYPANFFENLEYWKGRPIIPDEQPPIEPPKGDPDYGTELSPGIWDQNGDGVADLWDIDGDGKPDVTDTDGDGKPDAPYPVGSDKTSYKDPNTKCGKTIHARDGGDFQEFKLDIGAGDAGKLFKVIINNFTIPDKVEILDNNGNVLASTLKAIPDTFAFMLTSPSEKSAYPLKIKFNDGAEFDEGTIFEFKVACDPFATDDIPMIM